MMSDGGTIDMGIEENDDIILQEMKKIEELDASIHNLELQMKAENEELSTFQSQNREKLRELLLITPPEYGILSKNTNSFLDLYRNEGSDDYVNHEDDSNDGEETSNITDEDKERLEKLINGQDFDGKSESSPYFITEDLKHALKETTTEKLN